MRLLRSVPIVNIMIQNSVVFLVAFGLIVLAVGQFFVSNISLRKMRRRQSSIRQNQLEQLRNATKVARLNSQLSTSASDQARQWRVMEVLKVSDESNDAKSFYLADPNQQPLPAFYPGQYLMIRPALAGKYQATRCYSLSVAPNSKLWRITVKKQSTTEPLKADRKTGGLSTWLHDNIREGDVLLVGGPSGHFYLATENRAPLVLLAAGVGITPMASMLQYSSHFTPNRSVHLYYQAKDEKHWPLGAEVHNYCRHNPHAQVISYLSRSTPAQLQKIGQENAGQFRAGKIDIASTVSEVGLPSAHYFMCGPEEWMNSIRVQLENLGVPTEQIHWESFGSAATAANAASQTGQTSTFSVRFSRSGVSAQLESPDQSLWELAQANDVPIPSGCLSGVCGSCRVKLLQGKVQYDRNVAASLGENECLTCVARPASDVVLEV
ncbi:MAG: 2Fe-2S iron-sulfur cluster-binding protein [Pirellulales bacterium]